MRYESARFNNRFASIVVTEHRDGSREYVTVTLTVTNLYWNESRSWSHSLWLPVGTKVEAFEREWCIYTAALRVLGRAVAERWLSTDEAGAWVKDTRIHDFPQCRVSSPHRYCPNGCTGSGSGGGTLRFKPS